VSLYQLSTSSSTDAAGRGRWVYTQLKIGARTGPIAALDRTNQHSECRALARPETDVSSLLAVRLKWTPRYRWAASALWQAMVAHQVTSRKSLSFRAPPVFTRAKYSDLSGKYFAGRTWSSNDAIARSCRRMIHERGQFPHHPTC
jgi:hypothetical protein